MGRIPLCPGRLMRPTLALLSLLVGLTLVRPDVAHADSDVCNQSGDLNSQSVKCVKSGSETSGYIAGHSDHTYSIRPACEVGGLGLCAEPATCTIGGHDGYLYNVYQDADPDPLDWQARLTPHEGRPPRRPTPPPGPRALPPPGLPASRPMVQAPQGP